MFNSRILFNVIFCINMQFEQKVEFKGRKAKAKISIESI